MTEEPWPNWASDETLSVRTGITSENSYTIQIEDFHQRDDNINTVTVDGFLEQEK
jgi:hypothetical protein